MSAEHQPHNSERLQETENQSELLELANERHKTVEQQPDQKETQAERLEMARETIEKAPENKVEEAEKQKPVRKVNNVDKEASYSYTMQTLHRHMPAMTRNFSKFIHTPAVEKVSDVASVTVFRPSVTLGATTTAFIIGAALYVSAKQYGYYLPGSQFIIAIVAGGLLGAGIELIWKTIRKLRG